MASDATVDVPDADTPPERKDAVASIAGQIRYLSSGDRAQLRRIYLTGRHEADGIVIGLMHGAGLTAPSTPAAFAPWRLLAHCAALLSGTGAKQSHATGRRLGSALQAIGLSENRLLRLLSAQGAGLDSQVTRVFRMLAQRGDGPVNLRTLFDLVGPNPDRAEAARIRIAQDYYAATAAADKGDVE